MTIDREKEKSWCSDRTGKGRFLEARAREFCLKGLGIYWTDRILLAQYRVTFICQQRRCSLAVGSLQSESQSHVGGTNKFSINRRRRATIAPISLSRRRDGAYRISVVEITLKYAIRMTATRLSTKSLKINHTIAGSSSGYQDVNWSTIVSANREKFENTFERNDRKI